MAGLTPVVVQDAETDAVLMLAHANEEALEATRRTGEAHFWSRSRNELWRKGATSGNLLRVVDIRTDCDGDALLYRVLPAGPACHTGAFSCFAEPGERAPFSLARLERIIAVRAEAPPEDSYTARLMSAGPRRPAEKLVEEAGELAAAALVGDAGEVRAEAADLLYHALVLLAARDVSLTDVLGALAERADARSQAQARGGA